MANFPAYVYRQPSPLANHHISAYNLAKWW